ncbi:hypothetical protein [Nonomuraea turkmeniaca]|nr:hypothetical protein [Nonomuraea turkmeniaca]
MLAEPEWAEVLIDVDQRGLTSLCTTNMTHTGRCSCAASAAAWS